MRSKLGIFLISFGVLFSAVFASFTPVDWLKFAISISVLLAGVFLQRTGIRKDLEHGDFENKTLAGFENQIKVLKKKVEEHAQSVSSENVAIIDDEMKEVMPEVESYRFAIIEEVGVAAYTELISVYAKAERMINRGVSATIDEYFDEAKKCFANSLLLLDKTLEKTKEIHGAKR